MKTNPPDSNDPPVQVGPEREIVLTGMLMPAIGPSLVLIGLCGVDPGQCFLPLFQTEEQLRSVLERAKVPFDAIKHVDDGRTFLASLPPHITVITDLRFTEEGRVRFLQVQRTTYDESVFDA